MDAECLDYCPTLHTPFDGFCYNPVINETHHINRGLDVIQSHPVCRMCYGQYMYAVVSDSIGQVSNTELEMERNQIH